MREDKAHWPRCLLWHGWLPMLSAVNGVSPWDADASESAFYLVQTSLGRDFSGLVSEWSLPDGLNADEVSARMPDAPRVWSDGCLVLDSVMVFLFLLLVPECLLTSLSCAGVVAGAVMLIVLSDGVAHSCRGFVSFPGPLLTVQRAELWGVIAALQSSDAVHVGVDSLGVVRHVERLLDGGHCSPPVELVSEGSC